MKNLIFVLIFFLIATSAFSQEKSGLLVDKNIGKAIGVTGLAFVSAVMTHEAGHYLIAKTQGKEVGLGFGETTYKGDDNYLFSVGGVLATQSAYYLTRNSGNEFIKTYSEICRADLFYQVVKGATNNPEADLNDSKWIPFALLGAINLYEDRDFKITPLSITLKW